MPQAEPSNDNLLEQKSSAVAQASQAHSGKPQKSSLQANPYEYLIKQPEAGAKIEDQQKTGAIAERPTPSAQQQQTVDTAADTGAAHQFFSAHNEEQIIDLDDSPCNLEEDE